MPEKTQWEYRVATFGTALKRAKDEDIEAALNAWGEEGWEVVGVSNDPSSRVKVVAKRPLTSAVRRQRTIPGRY